MNLSGGEFAILLASRRLRVLRKFRKLGAISEKKAVALDSLELNNRERETLDFLVRKGKVKKTSDDRYYIP